jgi:Ser-tRNA(Ala) deacylase AlaX
MKKNESKIHAAKVRFLRSVKGCIHLDQMINREITQDLDISATEDKTDHVEKAGYHTKKENQKILLKEILTITHEEEETLAVLKNGKLKPKYATLIGIRVRKNTVCACCSFTN